MLGIILDCFFDGESGETLSFTSRSFLFGRSVVIDALYKKFKINCKRFADDRAPGEVQGARFPSSVSPCRQRGLGSDDHWQAHFTSLCKTSHITFRLNDVYYTK